MRAPQYGHSKGKRRSSNAAVPAPLRHNPARDGYKSRNDRERQYALPQSVESSQYAWAQVVTGRFRLR